jgi:hypothetical protein
MFARDNGICQDARDPLVSPLSDRAGGRARIASEAFSLRAPVRRIYAFDSSIGHDTGELYSHL